MFYWIFFCYTQEPGWDLGPDKKYGCVYYWSFCKNLSVLETKKFKEYEDVFLRIIILYCSLTSYWDA